jgi:hypothetical protein
MEWVYDNQQKRKRLIRLNRERLDMLNSGSSGITINYQKNEGIMIIE